MNHKYIVSILCLVILTGFAGIGFSQNVRANRPGLTENDVKTFVYQWFSWLDHQVGEFYFMSHLSSEGFEMRFPGVTIRDYTGFKKWYDCMRENIQWNSHEISNLTVSGDPEKGFDVELTVRWRAQTLDGDFCDNTYHHVWKLQPTHNELQFVITRYSVSQVDSDFDR
jgi:hypothetical protein